MRIFGLEITRAPKPDAASPLWNPSLYYENGRRINDMTPAELRAELIKLDKIIDETGSVLITRDSKDRFQRLRIV